MDWCVCVRLKQFKVIMLFLTSNINEHGRRATRHAEEAAASPPAAAAPTTHAAAVPLLRRRHTQQLSSNYNLKRASKKCDV